MNSPDSARDVSIKQEEPEDISIKQEGEEPEVDYSHFNILQVVVCKDEVPTEQERSPSLLQEEPEPPHIKEEPEEIRLPAGPMLTLLAVKSEVDDQDISSNCCEVKVEHECHTKDGDDGETSGGVITQSSRTQVFSCSECPYALTSQVFLYKHIRRRHLDLYCQMLRTGQITSSACQQQVTKSVTATKRAHRRPHQRPLPLKNIHVFKQFDKSQFESFNLVCLPAHVL